jgi:hypothetical protein
VAEKTVSKTFWRRELFVGVDTGTVYLDAEATKPIPDTQLSLTERDVINEAREHLKRDVTTS